MVFVSPFKANKTSPPQNLKRMIHVLLKAQVEKEERRGQGPACQASPLALMCLCRCVGGLGLEIPTSLRMYAPDDLDWERGLVLLLSGFHLPC